jgi:glyoxylase-like metal-dependent hydrolase (beta-lactamase superfamily II)
MTGTDDLRYDVLVSGLTPVDDTPTPDGHAPHWSPLSHTLIHGPGAAVVVDPPITRAQTTALADWIEARGKSLEYVYVTHWHGDHWLGAGQLLRRFPHATVLAGPATAQRIRASVADGAVPQLWRTLFPDQMPDGAAEVVLQDVPAEGFAIDGHRLHSVEVGHSDTDDSTVLHVPELGLVVAGDVVYNNVHQYLAETPDGGLEAWHRALDQVAGLQPRHVVAGHKDDRRDDSPANIDETRRYLDATAKYLESGPSRNEFYFRVVENFRERVNAYTVWLSARRLLGEFPAQHAAATSNCTTAVARLLDGSARGRPTGRDADGGHRMSPPSPTGGPLDRRTGPGGGRRRPERFVRGACEEADVQPRTDFQG